MKAIDLFKKNRFKQQFKLTSKLLLTLVLTFLILVVILFILKSKDNNQNNKQETNNEQVNQNSNKSILKICLDTDLQSELHETIKNWTPDEELINKYEFIFETYSQSIDSECTYHIARNTSRSSEYKTIWSDLYVYTTRIDSPIESISSASNQDINAISNQKYEEYEVVWDNTTYNFLKSRFGNIISQPERDSAQLKTVLLEDNQKIALLPFDQLTPQLKVLSVDGNTPTKKDFNDRYYKLIDSVSVKAAGNVSEEIKEDLLVFEHLIKSSLGESNYDKSKVTDILITGSSAIGAKSQYSIIESSGNPEYPIKNIKDLLISPSITHISNESPLTDLCIQETISFYYCGKTDAIKMLEEGGVDIISLSGEHILDYGRAEFEKTLDLYAENQLRFYGAGKNFNEASEPLIVEEGGGKFAFLAYNFQGPISVYAGLNSSGNISPDQYFGDGSQLRADIAKASELSDYIFVDMQWGVPYTNLQSEVQRIYGEVAIDAGADIVTGVHPNYVQGIGHYRSGIIFYGLGNFLIDDFTSEESRESIVVRHIFYNKKYIGYELSTLKMSDEIQLNVVLGEEREKILQNVYRNSNFNFLNINN